MDKNFMKKKKKKKNIVIRFMEWIIRGKKRLLKKVIFVGHESPENKLPVRQMRYKNRKEESYEYRNKRIVTKN